MLWQKEISVGVAQEISLEDSEERFWQEGEHAGIEGTTPIDTKEFGLGVVMWLFPLDMNYTLCSTCPLGFQDFLIVGLYNLQQERELG